MNYSYFPDPKPIELNFSDITMHQRYRVVLHCDREDAIEKAESLSEKHSCDLECFVAYIDNCTNESLGEVIVGRQLYPYKGAMAPAEETMEAVT